MSTYQNQFNFKGVVFTESNAVKTEALNYNLTVFTHLSRNEYGLPLISSMFEIMKENINANNYGYMNSDILLNPKVLTLLKNKQMLGIDNNTELVERVLEVGFPFSVTDFSTMKRINQVFSRNYTNTKLRNLLSADVFIFPKSFPFEKIPPIVIARRKVDTILMRVPQKINGCRIDFTDYGLY